MRLVLSISLFFCLMHDCSAHAGELEDIDRAILHVLEHGIPEHKLAPYPRHPLTSDPAARREFAEAIIFAELEHRVSRWLLMAISLREGSWLMDGKGDRGELSAWQIMPRTARWARRTDPRCNLDTYRGAALCAGVLLYHWTRKCGSEGGAIMRYVTGRTCRPSTDHLDWIWRDRLGIAQKLEGM